MELSKDSQCCKFLRAWWGIGWCEITWRGCSGMLRRRVRLEEEQAGPGFESQTSANAGDHGRSCRPRKDRGNQAGRTQNLERPQSLPWEQEARDLPLHQPVLVILL